jgi:hypothetical protein
MRRAIRKTLIGFSFCALGATGVLAAGALAAGVPRPGQACTAKNAAAYKRAHLICVNGHLKKRPTPASPAPAAPAPVTTTTPTTTEAPVPMPISGHYSGTTQQGYPIAFDARPDLKNLTNIVGGAVDETCSPSRAFQFYGFETGGFDYPISGSGVFTLNGGTKSDSGGVNSSTKIKVVANFDGTTAHGTYAVTSTFTDQGTSYACEASVTWTASHS